MITVLPRTGAKNDAYTSVLAPLLSRLYDYSAPRTGAKNDAWPSGLAPLLSRLHDYSAPRTDAKNDGSDERSYFKGYHDGGGWGLAGWLAGLNGWLIFIWLGISSG